MMEIFHTAILPNGLKIIHREVETRVAYCGVIVGVGSRDEREDEEGVAHFIEHVIFKGTEHRRAHHILARMEEVGGELNAYTTKEDTCIYSAFLSEDYDRALELFADIIRNSTFPEKEIEKEKEVVIDEINSYKDTPGELILDEFEEQLFSGYPISRNILGTEDAVRDIDRKRILEFIARNYSPQNMVVSSIGNIPFGKLVHMVEKYFGGMEVRSSGIERHAPELYTPMTRRLSMDTYQSHCVIGNRAYDQESQDRMTCSILMDLLGGAGMNSRLNLHIREKYGLVYDIDASYTPYYDTGMYTIYFGCNREDIGRCIKLCRKEMALLCDRPLGKIQLAKLKKQVVGQLEVSSENYENLMLTIGKSFLVFGKVDDLQTVCAKVEKITAEDLQRVASEVFNPDKLSILIYE